MGMKHSQTFWGIAFALLVQKIQNSGFQFGKGTRGHRKNKKGRVLNGHITVCRQTKFDVRHLSCYPL